MNATEGDSIGYLLAQYGIDMAELERRLDYKPRDNRKIGMTKSLASVLLLVGQYVKENDSNLVKLQDVPGIITPTQYNSFQQLRYFGLIAKHKVDGVRVPKEWVITSRGFKFLAGKDAGCHRWVRVKENHLTDRSPETCTLSQVWAEAPYLQTRFEYSDDAGNDLGERSTWDKPTPEPAGFDGEQARLV